jgi:hypothetical protein
MKIEGLSQKNKVFFGYIKIISISYLGDPHPTNKYQELVTNFNLRPNQMGKNKQPTAQ